MLTLEELRVHCNNNSDLLLQGTAIQKALTELLIPPKIRSKYLIPYTYTPVGIILNKFIMLSDLDYKDVTAVDWLELGTLMYHVRPYLHLGDFTSNLHAFKLRVVNKKNTQLTTIYKRFCKLTQPNVDVAIELCLKHHAEAEKEQTYV